MKKAAIWQLFIHKRCHSWLFLPPYFMCRSTLAYMYMNHAPIANTLREQRKKAGLRQIDVARKLGFSTAERISQWEKGKTYPHMINLFKLSSIFKVLPHELYQTMLGEMTEEKLSQFDSTVGPGILG